MLPDVAAGMNAMHKIVFSRTLDTVAWQNTTLLKGDLAAEVRAAQSAAGPDIVILGSGSIVSQLTEARLIDEYQIVVNPIVLGRGARCSRRSRRLDLRLTKTRSFANGNVVLWYELG